MVVTPPYPRRCVGGGVVVTPPTLAGVRGGGGGDPPPTLKSRGLLLLALSFLVHFAGLGKDSMKVSMNQQAAQRHFYSLSPFHNLDKVSFPYKNCDFGHIPEVDRLLGKEDIPSH